MFSKHMLFCFTTGLLVGLIVTNIYYTSMGTLVDVIENAYPTAPIVSSRIHHDSRHRLLGNFLRVFNGPDCENKGIFLKGLPKPLVLVEVGAFHGEDLPAFKDVVDFIFTFEPTPAKAGPIKANIKNNNMQHMVDFRNWAASNVSGSIDMYVECRQVDHEGATDNKYGSDIDNKVAPCKTSEQDTVGGPPPWRNQKAFNANKVKVPVTRLDEFDPLLKYLDQNRVRIGMIKIDTQGHEYAVLQGAKRLLQNMNYAPYVLHFEFSPNLLLNNNGVEGSVLLEYVTSFGYACFDCPSFSPPELAIGKRHISDYHRHFGDFMFGAGSDKYGSPEKANHGAWTDIVCIL